MRRWLQSLARNASGAAAVEFALVILPLLLLLFGIIELGLFFWTGHALQEAAVSGVRCMGLRVPGCATVDGALDPEQTRSLIQKAAATWGIGIPGGEIFLDEEIPDAERICPDPRTEFSEARIVHAYSSILPFFDGSEVKAEACFPNQP